MKNFGYVTLLVSVFFIACGDDVTNNTYVQSPIVAIEEGAELPACSMENDGTMTFVPDEGVIYFCYDGSWNPLKGKDGVDGEKGDKGDKGADGKNGTNGLNGLNGESCDVVAVEDGFNIVCGDTVKGTVKNGSDGEDGTSCTAKDTADTDGLKGLNVICGEKQVGTIWNGKDGSNGDDGKSCDAVATEGGYNIVCGGVVKGFVKEGTDGEDGSSCTAKDTTDTDGLKGLNVICGEKQVGTIWNGKDGSNGDDGKSCDAVATEGGYNIVCGGVVKGFVKEGTDGEDGTSCTAKDTTDTDGLKGLNVICGEKQVGTIWNGKDGSDGDDGKSCDAVATEGGYNIVCGGVIRGFVKEGADGEDGAGCTAKDTTDTDGLKGFNVICGEKQVGTIWNGKDGSNGDDGKSCDAVAVEGGYNIVCGGVVKGFLKDGSVSSLSSLSGSAVQTGNNVSGSIFDPVNNLLKDLRDGRFYKTTTIGSQIWMAEDLFANNTNLYNWTYAKARCPAGWHLPTKSEYETMVSAIGGSSVAGLKLKAAEGWGDYNGVDEYNFAAIPVGATTSVYYWTSTEGNGCSGAWAISLNTSNSSSFPCANQTYYYAVRCLKD